MITNTHNPSLLKALLLSLLPNPWCTPPIDYTNLGPDSVPDCLCVCEATALSWYGWCV